MIIVVPMTIQTLSLRYILETFLVNDPRKAILFGGCLLFIAAMATLMIKPTKIEREVKINPNSGH